ncbi:MAG: NADP-dependent oxidoreductase [Halobacteriales archaeon]
MTANRQWTLARRPEGDPVEEDFELVGADVPDPGDGEVLVRTLYLSVDPYMRGRMDGAWDPGQVMRASVVGEVEASNHPEFAPGETVTGELRWAEYAVAHGRRLTRADTGEAPASTALGVLGMPGRTAYFGVVDVLDPSPGDTVVVSAAAGAVGSAAGQVADEAGCRVIGIAGSDRKVAFVEDDCGLAAGINYRREDVGARLDDLTDGIDGYFDNVGGPITDAVIDRLADRGSVAVCGQIALYNAEGTPTGPRHLRSLIGKSARIEGFLVSDFADRYGEANGRLRAWVADGTLAYRESVVEGFENAPAAFIGLFEGENIGKQVVRVD